MQIISLSGVDGSGKTTQLKKLKKYLEKNNKKIAVFHAVSFSLVNSLIKKHKIKKQKLPNQHPQQGTIFNQPAKAVTTGSFLTIFARKIVLPIDIIRFKRFQQQLIKQNVDYLLTDRYFYDQIINILYLSYQKKILKAMETKGCRITLKLCPLLKLSLKIMPKPNYSFFIDLPSQIILQRDKQIEQDEKYLIIKRSLYKKFITAWHIQKINGAEKIENVFSEIINVIQN